MIPEENLNKPITITEIELKAKSLEKNNAHLTGLGYFEDKMR